ncbi:MAG: hypothetical protein ACR2NN_22490 [Bryobacteraceae bacterium]
MSGLTISEKSLVIVQAAASAGLVCRFLVDGLNRTYRFFFLYLVVFCIQESEAFFLTMGTNAYGLFFIVTEVAIVFLYALITLELYSLVLKNLAGIATVTRRYVRAALVIAILLSVLLVGIEQTPKNIISYLFGVERPIVTSLFCFVFLITGFLVYYPIPLNRNVIFYTIGYAIYFTSKATTLFMRNTGSRPDMILGLVMLAVSTGCLIFWIFALTRKGEEAKLTIGRGLTAQDEERLRQQLEAINASFSRASK